LWQESGRWQKYIDDGTMMIVKTDRGNLGLAPTAEEAIVSFARTKLKSYKDLPVTFYQIGEKFRNEIRNRGYLLRGRSFPMMDAYSFGRNEADLRTAYANMRSAYMEFFARIGLDILPVVADSGAIGGSSSEEFMLIAPFGEDTILYNPETNEALNTEVLERPEYKNRDMGKFQKLKACELGHIFQLGTKYSAPMNGNFVDESGAEKTYLMGCYGIGMTRVMAVVYEKAFTKNAITLPENIAPYKLQIIPKKDNADKIKEATALYNELTKNGIPVILDDRPEIGIGPSIKDAKILGTPYIGILGDKTNSGEIEIEKSSTGEKKIIKQTDLLNATDLQNFLKVFF
jgi:prolyl-tRNA synthetase